LAQDLPFSPNKSQKLKHAVSQSNSLLDPSSDSKSGRQISNQKSILMQE